MNALQNWLTQLADAPALVLLVVITKLTLLLAAAWVAHGALARANPRWRVLVWRLTAVGCALVIVLAACPPLFQWGVLPASTAGGMDNVASATYAPEATASAPHNQDPSPAASFNREPPATASASPNEGQSTTASFNPEPTATASRPAIVATTAPRAAPTPSPSSAAANQTWLNWTLTIWLTGLVLLGGRTAIGLIRFRNTRRRAMGVPAWIIEESAAVAGKLGCKRNQRVTVLQTNAVSAPCLIGLFRPILLLPARQCTPEHRADLPAILAHEFAHIKNHDLPWNAALHALTHALWFHPLAWRIRPTHAAACDAVSDAIAADYLGDANEYSRTLARLAVRIAAPITTPGLAMARTSDVRRRIEALKRFLFHKPLSRGRAGLLVAVGALAVTLLGGIALTRAQVKPSDAPPAQDAPRSPLEVGIPEAERFDWQPEELVAVLGTHRGRHWWEVLSVAYSPDGKYVVSGGGDNAIRVWDAATMLIVTEVRNLPGSVRSLSFCHDGSLLAASVGDGQPNQFGEVRVWEWKDGDLTPLDTKNGIRDAARIRRVLSGHANACRRLPGNGGTAACRR